MDKRKNSIEFIDLAIAGLSLALLALALGLVFLKNFNRKYAGLIYPNVSIHGIPFGGRTQTETRNYWLTKNQPFATTDFTFVWKGEAATVSGSELELGYDATLSATQAYLVGRSGNFLSDLVIKFFTKNINLTPLFHRNTEKLQETLDDLAENIDIPVQEALFQFSGNKVTGNKVTEFHPSSPGRKLNSNEAFKRFTEALAKISEVDNQHFVIELPVDTLSPFFTTEKVNSFGIKSLLGSGFSEFSGSAPERIHNVVLAASKLNGTLIPPGEVFSFNEAVGDISKTTGFLQAYVIQSGRTVLGDGGGVCQVSTTLFRAALNAGLPIVERHAHDYRVHYYEEGGFKPGLDATVFAPSVDLKFKNDTPGYILIQAKTDLKNLNLTFDLYGAGDGRIAAISDQRVWDVTAPPPDLYQDDPTIPKGTAKQVDFAAWGAKASFHYTVAKNGETLENTDFYSDFRPWQAIFLRGTKE